ncbi:Claudin-15 [Ophiophagus hannah]|uniref:Claudin n=1 Tax=Ophiophagus hannah TaxID=8665 RepID=V8P4V4_OPHHA|nr:Claudin-15 [Ophiophagus hannah]
MSLLLETVGFFLSTVGWALLAVTLFNSYWRVSSVSGNVITTSTIFENLWQSCATDSTGVYNCWEFQSLLELPAVLDASQGYILASVHIDILCPANMLDCKPHYPQPMGIWTAYLQASRALMITALVLGFLAIVTSMLGLQSLRDGDRFMVRLQYHPGFF